MSTSWSHALFTSLSLSSQIASAVSRVPHSSAASSVRSRDEPPNNKFADVPILNPDGGRYPFVIEIQGGMNRTDEDAVDGLAIDLFSPTGYIMTINTNPSPIAAKVVSNVGGGLWIPIQDYSWVITTDTPADDLVGILELPYDPVRVQALGLDVANLHIGRLSSSGNEWLVDGSNRNVHVSENKTRMLAMNNMAGEFNLFGRSLVDTAQSLIQFGYFPFSPTRTMNITSGPGFSNAIFVDNFAISIESTQSDVFVNCVLSPKSSEELRRTLPTGAVPMTSYTHLVNASTTAPYLTGIAGPSVITPIKADVTMPFTAFQLASINARASSLRVAYRGPGQADFSILLGVITIDTSKFQVQVAGLTSVDGEFLLVGGSAVEEIQPEEGMEGEGDEENGEEVGEDEEYRSAV